MTLLVTGSAGHLGEALVRTLRANGDDVIGADILPSPFTAHVGSVADTAFANEITKGVDAIIHAATLHKPHVATHTRQQFVDTNITGTLNLLEAAVKRDVSSFVFTSTTSAFGNAMSPEPDAPAVWVSEDLTPRPKNIYGVTKLAAENLCGLFHELHQLPVIVLRTSRFFPEEDDSKAMRDGYEDLNAKVNEFLNRRVDIEDAVDAHLKAIECAPRLGIGTYIVSATSPFTKGDLPELTHDAPSVVRRYFDYDDEFARRGWSMFPKIERVYVNDRARNDLGWRPKYDFGFVLAQLIAGEPPFSALSSAVGAKGYHSETFDGDGPYPVE